MVININFGLEANDTKLTGLYNLAIDAALNGITDNIDQESAIALLKALLTKNQGIEQAITLLKEHKITNLWGPDSYAGSLCYSRWEKELKDAANRTKRNIDF